MRKHHGIISLGVTILLGGIIVEIGAAVAFLTYVLNQDVLGTKLSAEAYAGATSGIEDGILKVIRGVNSQSSGTGSFTIGSVNVDVEICTPTTCADIFDPRRKITATANNFLKVRQLTAIVGFDPTTRRVSIESIEER